MSSLPFKVGERIALPSLPILRIDNNVAILKKTRLVVEDGCGLRHRVRVETPFMLRGGFRVQRVARYKVPSWAFTVVYATPYGTTAEEKLPVRAVYLDEMPDPRTFAERLLKEMYGNAKVLDVKVNEQAKAVSVYTRQFRHAVVEIPEDDYFLHIHRLDGEGGDTYFVYEFVNESEAKLVDDTSRIDYVLHIFNNNLASRSTCAKIKILSGDVVWQDIRSTCCANASNAVAMIVAKYGARIAVAKNDAPYRGHEEWAIEEWESTLPPRLTSSYRTIDPIQNTITPEDVV